MLDSLDMRSVGAWASAAADALEAHRAEIDEINVFPVADADTGTNLASTMRAACDALLAAVDDRSVTDAATALRSLARGAALAARGNSGVILAELLRGLADGLEGAPSCDATRLRHALEQAADSAYRAVGVPTEGTILSVARAAALAAADLAADAPLDVVVCAARDGALAALARTPQQLEVLASAGVVDAGGRGLVVVLDALCTVVTGEASVLREVAPAVPMTAPVTHEIGSPEFAYEVQYLLVASRGAVAELRDELLRLGDSLTVAEADHETWNVHVHVNDVGAAIEAGLRAGRPSQVAVTRFAATPDTARSTVVVVVLLARAGLQSIFEEAGARVVVVSDPAGAQPAVFATLTAIGAGRVVLLPTDEELGALAAVVAGQARSAGIEVAVVPTRSPMQGLAAVAVHDPTRRGEDDIIAMAEAAAATRFARVEVAAGPGLTTIGPCRAGDVLGLIDGDVVEMGASADEVALSVLARLLGIGGELVTAVLGARAPAGIDERIGRCVAERAPLVELVIYPDQQLDCVLLFGME